MRRAVVVAGAGLVGAVAGFLFCARYIDAIDEWIMGRNK